MASAPPRVTAPYGPTQDEESQKWNTVEYRAITFGTGFLAEISPTLVHSTEAAASDV